MSSYGRKPSSGYLQQNDPLEAKMKEEEKKNNSINNIVIEALAGADSLPRGKWVVGRSPTPTPTPTPDEDDPPSGFWGSAATAAGVAAGAVGVAAGVALVARGLWNLANSPEPEPETPAEKKKGKMMKAPGRDYKIYRDDFVRNPKAYFQEDRLKRKLGL